MEGGTLAASAAAPLPERNRPLAERIGEAKFALFYEAVAPRFWAFLFSQCRDRSLADDLCQETFTRVLASGLEPASDEHLTRYLYKTGIHLLRDRGRRSGREPLPLLEALDLGARAAPEGLASDLARALGALSPRERELLWLAHVEELDHRAIAETVGARPGSVRVMLHRARRRLAKLLGRDERKAR